MATMTVLPAPAPWLHFVTVTATVNRTDTDVAEMEEALCYGRDAMTHLSTMGTTIVKGR